MDNRVAGCQPPAGATPLLRFGLPSPPSVVGMVMAPGSASGKHPFYVVWKCGLGCCVCGGRRVGAPPPPPPDRWAKNGERWTNRWCQMPENVLKRTARTVSPEAAACVVLSSHCAIGCW